MHRFAPLIVLAALYLLHQDFWLWTSVRPLVFGFLPVGLFYHAAYTVGISFVLFALMPYLWPAHLDEPDR